MRSCASALTKLPILGIGFFLGVSQNENDQTPEHSKGQVRVMDEDLLASRPDVGTLLFSIAVIKMRARSITEASLPKPWQASMQNGRVCTNVEVNDSKPRVATGGPGTSNGDIRI